MFLNTITIRTTTQTVCCWSSPAVMSAVSRWLLGSCLPYMKFILAIYCGINNSHFWPSSVYSVEENEKPFLLERCAPQGTKRGNRKCRGESGRQRGRVFPFIITISSSFCSVAVTGSIASITVSLSAMWRHDKLVTIHKSSELMQYCSQVSVPEERNTIDEISLIYWLVLIDWNVS